MGQVISWAEGRKISENLRAHGQTIVFTNGLFDILHVGHLHLLQGARALGDMLIVGLNSDASARAFKDEGHPVVPQGERAWLLSAIGPVDYVIIFDEPTAERLVDHLRPDVYVKGGDYHTPGPGTASQGRKVAPEARVVLAYGGQVEILLYLEGHSTSDLIHRILETYGRSG